MTKFKDEMGERSRVRGTEQILNEASCSAPQASTRNRKVGVRGRQGQVIGCLTLRRNLGEEQVALLVIKVKPGI